MRLSPGLPRTLLPGTPAAAVSLSRHVTSPLLPALLQECAEGYTRSSSGLYLGTCERCNCNGHASSCDPESGSCLVGVGSAHFLACFHLLRWNLLAACWRILTCGDTSASSLWDLTFLLLI